jgi:hypothetical protein
LTIQMVLKDHSLLSATQMQQQHVVVVLLFQPNY